MTITAVRVPATPEAEREADAPGGAPVELTVAFTDLEDFTTYTEAEGDDAARRMLIDHHRESEAIVGSRGGRVLKWLGDDVIGRVVNLASRVAQSAEGGELVVTGHVRTAVGDLRGIAFSGPYTRSFKGIEATVPLHLVSRCR